MVSFMVQLLVHSTIGPTLFKSHVSILVVQSFLPSLGFKEDPQKAPINFEGESPAGAPRPTY